MPDLSDPQLQQALSLENWEACVYNLDCAGMDIATPAPTLTPTASPTETPGSPSPTDTGTPTSSPSPSSTATPSAASPQPTPSGGGSASLSFSRAEVLGAPSIKLSQSDFTWVAVPPALGG